MAHSEQDTRDRVDQEGDESSLHVDTRTTRTPESPESPMAHMTEAMPADAGGGDDYGFAAAMEREADMGVVSLDQSPVDQTATASASVAATEERLRDDIDGRPQPFERSSSPLLSRKQRKQPYERVQDLPMHKKLHKISVYETQTRFFLIGGDITETHWRMLKIDRTAPPGRLIITEDEVVYNRKEMNQLLHTLEHGNKAAGGMHLKITAWGLLGFIRFTESYYMILVTKRQQVAMIGGHYIYQIEDTATIPLTTGSTSRFQSNRNPIESRYLSVLSKLDLHQAFYFSYSYNLTRTLQHNVIRARQRAADQPKSPDLNSMFVWNQYLLDPALEYFKNPYDWCIPVMHGSVEQCEVNVFGRSIYIALIARRSRFFAGARFLKRGANDLGFVANDVETEQIVADMMATSLNGSTTCNNPNYTSFVQHRGSIPLYWTQDNSGVSPKPDIDLNLVDPFYASAALHFDHLFQRYGAPVCVLNLVKTKERHPREGKLLVEYQNAINYLNQQLPADKKILYRSFDMARAAKTPGQDVIASLEEIAQDLVAITGFFHIGDDDDGDDKDSSNSRSSVQNGVIRSNCIDCLDRTNAAQFVIGKRALECQLQTLGVTADASLNFDTDVINLFAHMFNDHGDTLASQYGGSHLVNTTDSYRKVNNTWQTHSRDMLESFKRYYHNSFFDRERQEAYNLFLGNYIFAQGQPMLWELASDYYLHHANPASYSHIARNRRSYVYWYTPAFLRTRTLPPPPPAASRDDSWWHEYYRPQLISSYMRLFGYNIKSTTQSLPKVLPASFDPSPFAIRKRHALGEEAAASPHVAQQQQQQHHQQEPQHGNNQVAASDSHSREVITPLSATQPPHPTATRISSLQKWLQSASDLKTTRAPTHAPAAAAHLDLVDAAAPNAAAAAPTATAAPDPNPATDKTQWPLAQLVHASLHPAVSPAEAQEYERYVSHPQNLSLVNETPADAARKEEFDEWIDADYDLLDGQLLGSRAEYGEWMRGAADASSLSLLPGELETKRYRAYAKWLTGKSFFKQSKVDPEFRSG